METKQVVAGRRIIRAIKIFSPGFDGRTTVGSRCAIAAYRANLSGIFCLQIHFTNVKRSKNYFYTQTRA